MGASIMTTRCFRSFAVIVVGVTSVLVGTGEVTAQEPGSPAREVLVASRAEHPPDYVAVAEASSDWSVERMRAARPIEEYRGRSTSAAERTPLAAKPGNKRKQTQSPFRQFGVLFGHIPGQGDFSCSGTTVRSAPKDLVSTAGHCVFDDGSGEWFDELTFVPAYRGWKSSQAKAAPFGQFRAADAFIDAAWAGSDFSVDFAFVETAASVQRVVGGHKPSFNQAPEQKYKAYGWPATLSNGERIYKCKSFLVGRDDSAAGKGPATLGIDCDMTAGASGGGWIINVNARKIGQLVSLVSYGYDELPGILYGPYFGNAARALFNLAASCSSGGSCPG